MKAFLRENPTIAFGLGLPLLLVVAFLLISGIPALLVEPPQYDPRRSMWREVPCYRLLSSSCRHCSSRRGPFRRR